MQAVATQWARLATRSGSSQWGLAQKCREPRRSTGAGRLTRMQLSVLRCCLNQTAAADDDSLLRSQSQTGPRCSCDWAVAAAQLAILPVLAFVMGCAPCSAAIGRSAGPLQHRPPPICNQSAGTQMPACGQNGRMIDCRGCGGHCCRPGVCVLFRDRVRIGCLYTSNHRGYQYNIT